VPGYANPQNLNRYSYVVNNPLRYTDQTGHWVTECEFSGGCGSVSQAQKDQDAQKLARLKSKSNDRKCTQGNDAYCSTAIKHPLETTLFVGGGLLLAGGAAASVSYLSAAEAAATINAGINVTTDYVFTRLSHKQYSLKDGATTALFSLLIGSAGGVAAEYFGKETAQQAAKIVVAQAVIQLIGNTAHRLVQGKSTGMTNGEMDLGSAALSATLQITVDADPYVLSHAGEAMSSTMQAIIDNSYDPQP